jgi:hypothetical protein
MVRWEARIAYVIALLCALAAWAQSCGLPSTASAPQAASWYAKSLAWAVIPYCVARCIDKAFPPAPPALPSPPKAQPPAKGRTTSSGVYEIE